jgi:hypothetical protein
MGNCTGHLALFATNAALRVNENSFHIPVPFYKRNTKQLLAGQYFRFSTSFPPQEKNDTSPLFSIGFLKGEVK